MESTTIIKNNILIALFERETAKFLKGKRASKGFDYIEYRDKKGNYDGQTLVLSLNYHKSWDSLMLVVEKIETLPNTHVNIKQNECTIVTADRNPTKAKCLVVTDDNKLQAVYVAVVKFIEWYNTPESRRPKLDSKKLAKFEEYRDLNY